MPGGAAGRVPGQRRRARSLLAHRQQPRRAGDTARKRAQRPPLDPNESAPACLWDRSLNAPRFSFARERTGFTYTRYTMGQPTLAFWLIRVCSRAICWRLLKNAHTLSSCLSLPTPFTPLPLCLTGARSPDPSLLTPSSPPPFPLSHPSLPVSPTTFSLSISFVRPRCARRRAQVLASVRVSGAWPELLRRVARELRFPCRETLRTLYIAEYTSLSLLARAELLSHLCAAVLNTLELRIAVDSRMERTKTTLVPRSELLDEPVPIDWQLAALAGVVQGKALHQLPRVEPIGRDRNHSLYWPLPLLPSPDTLCALRQPVSAPVAKANDSARAAHTEGRASADGQDAGDSGGDGDIPHAAHDSQLEGGQNGERTQSGLPALNCAVGGRSYGFEFDVITMDGLRRLRGQLDTRGRREFALQSATACVLVQHDRLLDSAASAAPAAIATAVQGTGAARIAALARRNSAGGTQGFVWPNPLKDHLPNTCPCPICHRRVRPFGDFAEHLEMCAVAGVSSALRPSPLQRQVLRILALELAIPRPLLKDSWHKTRKMWRMRLVRAGSANSPKMIAIAKPLLELQENISPVLFNEEWSPEQSSARPATVKAAARETVALATASDGPVTATATPAKTGVRPAKPPAPPATPTATLATPTTTSATVAEAPGAATATPTPSAAVAMPASAKASPGIATASLVATVAGPAVAVAAPECAAPAISVVSTFAVRSKPVAVPTLTSTAAAPARSAAHATFTAPHATVSAMPAPACGTPAPACGTPAPACGTPAPAFATSSFAQSCVATPCAECSPVAHQAARSPREVFSQPQAPSACTAATRGDSSQIREDVGICAPLTPDAEEATLPPATPCASPGAAVQVSSASRAHGHDDSSVRPADSAERESASRCSASKAATPGEMRTCVAPDGTVLQLLRSHRSSSGFKGVYNVHSNTEFEARYKDMTLGFYPTKYEAASTVAIATYYKGVGFDCIRHPSRAVSGSGGASGGDCTAAGGGGGEGGSGSGSADVAECAADNGVGRIGGGGCAAADAGTSAGAGLGSTARAVTVHFKVARRPGRPKTGLKASLEVRVAVRPRSTLPLSKTKPSRTPAVAATRTITHGVVLSVGGVGRSVRQQRAMQMSATARLGRGGVGSAAERVATVLPGYERSTAGRAFVQAKRIGAANRPPSAASGSRASVSDADGEDDDDDDDDDDADDDDDDAEDGEDGGVGRRRKRRRREQADSADDQEEEERANRRLRAELAAVEGEGCGAREWAPVYENRVCEFCQVDEDDDMTMLCDECDKVRKGVTSGFRAKSGSR
eukprot:5854028-Pleurochrysis_carterae.AAC.1